MITSGDFGARSTATRVIRDGVIRDGVIRDGVIRDGVIRDGAIYVRTEEALCRVQKAVT